MKLTKRYLLDNRTEKGGFTRQQLKILGIKWPPQAGWLDDLEGVEITEQQKAQFEISKEVLANSTKKNHAKVSESIEMKLIELIDYVESLELRISELENPLIK